MKQFLCLLMFIPCMSLAQNPKLEIKDDFKFGKHLEVGAVAGSSGIGVELSTPINEHLNLRAGFSVMPTIKSNQGYNMTACGSLGENLSKEEQSRRINHLCEDYLSKMINTPVDTVVDLTRQIGFYNGKILLDWYPFHKKNWYFTAGVYFGSKNVGKVFNTQEESATMLAINMYNRMYDQIQNLGEYEYPSFNFGKYSYEMDPDVGPKIKAAFNEYGRVAVRVGDDLDGNPNYLEPNEQGIMKADAKVNFFKPYIGFGYNTNIGYDKRWSFGFNAGAMYWGKLSVIYYRKNGETIDLVRDVKNVGGIVGQYLKVVKYLPIYPVIELHLAYTIF